MRNRPHRKPPTSSTLSAWFRRESFFCRPSLVGAGLVGVVLAFGLATPTAAQKKSSSAPPVYVDPSRGINKQRDAANAAVADARKGAAEAEKTLRHLADVSGLVRDRVFRVVLDQWSDEDFAALLPGLASKQALTREAVAELYGVKKYAAGKNALLKSLASHKDDETRVMCLWALARVGDSEVVPRIETLLKREKRSFRVKGEALRTLVQLDEAAGRAKIDDLLSDKLLPVRIEALEQLSRIDKSAFLAAATSSLAKPPKDKRREWAPRLLRATLDLLRSLPGDASLRTAMVPAIEALIARADSLDGRERVDLFRTLRSLTGTHDLPDETFSWQSWWDANREKWTPVTAKEQAKKKEPTTGVVRYHGEAIDSKRITFVVDVSGGMDRPLEQGKEGASRLEHAKQELDRVLRALPDEDFVNVLYFGSYYQSYQEVPVLLRKGRKRLLAFNAEQQIPKKIGHARGNLYDTLVFAVSRPHTDTVYLLSEGGPTEGKFQDNQRFLTHFARWNRYYRVRVRTLLIGQTGGRARDLLRRIAEDSGGEYTDLMKR